MIALHLQSFNLRCERINFLFEVFRFSEHLFRTGCRCGVGAQVRIPLLNKIGILYHKTYLLPVAVLNFREIAGQADFGSILVPVVDGGCFTGRDARRMDFYGAWIAERGAQCIVYSTENFSLQTVDGIKKEVDLEQSVLPEGEFQRAGIAEELCGQRTAPKIGVRVFKSENQLSL